MVGAGAKEGGRRAAHDGALDDLVTLKELIDAGTVVPVIDRTCPLGETASAMAHVGGGHARGQDRHHVWHEVVAQRAVA